MKPHNKLQLICNSKTDDLPKEGHPFSLGPYLKIIQQETPFPLEIIKIFEGTTLLAWLPYQIRKTKGMTHCFEPLFTPVGGPWFNIQREHFSDRARKINQINHLFLEHLKNKASWIQLVPPSEALPQALFEHWQSRYSLRGILDLSRLSPHFFSTDTRRSLRKAQNAGLHFSLSQDNMNLAQAYERTFAKQNTNSGFTSASLMIKVKQGLELESQMDSFVLSDHQQNNLAFASAFEAPNDRVYLWHLCSTEKADSLCAMYELIWKISEYYKNIGFKEIHLGGMDHQGLFHFKSNFCHSLETQVILELKKPFLRLLELF